MKGLGCREGGDPFHTTKCPKPFEGVLAERREEALRLKMAKISIFQNLSAYEPPSKRMPPSGGGVESGVGAEVGCAGALVWEACAGALVGAAAVRQHEKNRQKSQ